VLTTQQHNAPIASVCKRGSKWLYNALANARPEALLLCCAVLCCAVLCCAVLCCAVLCCAVLCCAVLCCAVLCCAVLLLVAAGRCCSPGQMSGWATADGWTSVTTPSDASECTKGHPLSSQITLQLLYQRCFLPCFGVVCRLLPLAASCCPCCLQAQVLTLAVALY
jgi:hypothetical protein